jgi:hypothetical protein
VLAFIKSRWPVGTRASQAMLNPHQEGMPDEVGDWRFPPSCSVAPWRIGGGPDPSSIILPHSGALP